MKTIKIKLSILVCFLISISIIMTSVNSYGQNKTSTQNQTDQKKKESIRKIKKTIDETEYQVVSVKKILRIAKKSKLNFDTYEYIASLVSEFGYHTDPLVKIAKFASMAKVESKYFIQLSDLVVMKLSETEQIVDLAMKVSKLDTPTNEEIDKQIQEIIRTIDFKTMADARVYNKNEIDKILNRR